METSHGRRETQIYPVIKWYYVMNAEGVDLFKIVESVNERNEWVSIAVYYLFLLYLVSWTPSQYSVARIRYYSTVYIMVDLCLHSVLCVIIFIIASDLFNCFSRAFFLYLDRFWSWAVFVRQPLLVLFANWFYKVLQKQAPRRS